MNGSFVFVTFDRGQLWSGGACRHCALRVTFLNPATLQPEICLSLLDTMSVDFGSKLQDQLPALFDSLEVLHSHLHDISHYYSGQAEIERAVVQQHKALLKKVLFS